MLKISHLTKTYGNKVKAVDDLSLTIEKGDIFAFIGHNGAGKTTTIKAVCGIHTFDDGEIFIDGVSLKSDPIHCKKMTAYIPDSPDLYEFMRADKYINFVSDMYDVPSAQRKELIEKYATGLEIKKDLSSPVSSFSHGMKQKVALIAALVHKPKLLILDEPFVGLDPKSSHVLKGYFKEMTDAGGAIFFSTHILEVAQKLCNKIAIIKNGKLVVCGETEKVIGMQSLEDVFLELTDND